MKRLQITAQERIVMKSREKDNAKPKKHPVKVTIQDDNLKTVEKQDLKAEDKGENTGGIAQNKAGLRGKDFTFVYENALIVRPVAGPLMLIDTK
jgi:hypothetical protein